MIGRAVRGPAAKRPKTTGRAPTLCDLCVLSEFRFYCPACGACADVFAVWPRRDRRAPSYSHAAIYCDRCAVDFVLTIPTEEALT
jgi:hypothetical protein